MREAGSRAGSGPPTPQPASPQKDPWRPPTLSDSDTQRESGGHRESCLNPARQQLQWVSILNFTLGLNTPDINMSTERHHSSYTFLSLPVRVQPQKLYSLLRLAARHGLSEVASFVLQQPGGRQALRRTDAQGDTAAQEAARRGHEQLLELFKLWVHEKRWFRREQFIRTTRLTSLCLLTF